jgi:hydrogenase nickel incorporation protein HypB
LLAPNDEIARENRAMLATHGVYAANLMSAPGAGKTSLLERLVPRLTARHRLVVIEGDIVGREDARRIERLGVPVEQINTGGACHLDARMVHHAVHRATDGGFGVMPDVVLIENVGNLVCPAEFDLGEDDAIMLLSLAEGDDKPKKYPLMFRRADVVLITKLDLSGFTDFSLPAATRAIRDVHPGVTILPLSCRTGEGLAEVEQWLEGRIAAKVHAAGRV